MGLRLRKHSSSFPSALPGPPPARASDSETEIYTVSTPEPFSYDYQDPNRPPLRTAQQDSLDGRQRKRRRLLTLCTRDDAAEGDYASLALSDDNTFSIRFTEPQWCSRPSSRRRRSSSTALSPRRVSRPPSLERQDAFRDERTAKSRHAHHRHHHHGYSYDALVIASSYLLLAGQSEMAERQGSEAGDDGEGAEEQIADLCRMGLLRYDNDRELDRIGRRDVAEGPAKWARREDSGFGSLCSVDLAFAALAEHQALAGWLVSGAIIDGCNGTNEEEGGVDPWDVLGHDGS